MKPFALWITGLSGSGKSTVADALKARHPDLVILRMDELRKAVTPEPTYSEAERDLVYRAIVHMAETLVGLGHGVIIDATGNLRKWRDLARQSIPGYVEVYLRCDAESCKKREEARKELHGAPKDIYKKGEAGWPVPGVNVPYEEPLNAEVVIDTSTTGVDEAVRIIEARLGIES